MAETNYTVIDFSTLSQTDDGNTILYNGQQLCRSTTSLGEVVNSKILAKGYATETAVNNTINALSGTITADYATKNELGTVSDAVGELSGAVTANYATKEDLGKVGNFIITEGNDSGPSLDPASAQTKSIYLILDDTVTGKDQYNEWVVTTGTGTPAWTCIGETTIDLSDYALTEDVNNALNLKQDVFTAGASNNDLLTYTQNDGLSWSSPTAILDDNINHDVLEINNDGVLDFNYYFIDGSGGLTFNENNRRTLIVNLSNNGAINHADDGELYVGTDNTLTVKEKVGYNDTYLSVTNPVPDPGSNQHRGHVLTVNNSDGIAWQAPTALTAGTDLVINNGEISVNTNGTATGNYAFAEGAITSAFGDYSHAEGGATVAAGNYSHAEGGNTRASGNYSHAEGENTRATAYYSHAEGTVTRAYGKASHAEGGWTSADGIASHAEGSATRAAGDYSHAEGQNTFARNNVTHAEGYNTTAFDSYGHAEGYETSACYMAHSEGHQTSAVGAGSHAEGDRTIASGNYSHAAGLCTVADVDNMTVIGKYNSTKSAAFVIGNGTNENNLSDTFIVNWQGVASATKLATSGFQDVEQAINSKLDTTAATQSYVSKTDYDNLYNAFTGLTAWLSPISANIVTASNN